MTNKKNEINNILLGAIIGGLIGGGALYFLSSSKDTTKPMLNKIGRAISDLGAMLEDSRVDDSGEAIENIERTLPKGDNVVTEALNLIATGINLWNNFKKGK